MKKVPLFGFALFFLVGCGENIEVTVDTGTPPTPIATSFSAKLTKEQEIDPPIVTTTPIGTGSFSLNAEKTEFAFEMTATNLSGAITSAYFYNAAVGSTGIKVKKLTFINNTASGIWKRAEEESLTSLLVAELEAGRLYVNIHTTANPAGEIRGQINLIASGSKGFTSKARGSQEVPAVLTTATATGAFSLNSTKTELTFDITATGLSGGIESVHIHKATEGASGEPFPVLVLSPTDNTVSGVWKSTDVTSLTPALVSELEAGRLYVNIHTTAKKGGEIRGQIVANP